MVWVRSERSLMLLRIGLISMAGAHSRENVEKLRSILHLRPIGSTPASI
ncbi:hypothetical protein M003_00695 [Pseudomonas aeruginosa IGB83]|nr:hypothetical protein M003_00695 [Pseudomonas aeruginosa IGB83]